jgi:hypothetical protein
MGAAAPAILATHALNLGKDCVGIFELEYAPTNKDFVESAFAAAATSRAAASALRASRLAMTAPPWGLEKARDFEICLLGVHVALVKRNKAAFACEPRGATNKTSSSRPSHSAAKLIFKPCTVFGKCAKGAEALRGQIRLRDHAYKIKSIGVNTGPGNAEVAITHPMAVLPSLVAVPLLKEPPPPVPYPKCAARLAPARAAAAFELKCLAAISAALAEPTRTKAPSRRL